MQSGLKQQSKSVKSAACRAGEASVLMVTLSVEEPFRARLPVKEANAKQGKAVQKTVVDSNNEAGRVRGELGL